MSSFRAETRVHQKGQPSSLTSRHGQGLLKVLGLAIQTLSLQLIHCTMIDNIEVKGMARRVEKMTDCGLGAARVFWPGPTPEGCKGGAPRWDAGPAGPCRLARASARLQPSTPLRTSLGGQGNKRSQADEAAHRSEATQHGQAQRSNPTLSRTAREPNREQRSVRLKSLDLSVDAWCDSRGLGASVGSVRILAPAPSGDFGCSLPRAQRTDQPRTEMERAGTQSLGIIDSLITFMCIVCDAKMY